jgi:hypothetical protein
MKFLTLLFIFILASITAHADIEKLSNEEQLAWETESINEYAGSYTLKENDSTFYGRVIITSYADKGKLLLSLCFIDVTDVANKPKYYHWHDLSVDKNGNAIRSGKSVGLFFVKKNKVDDNVKIKYALNLSGKLYVRD